MGIHAAGYPPNFLISSNSASVRPRGTSSLATFTLCTWCWMFSTISGLARVVTSPTSAKLEMDAITRRMIFPDLVLGMWDDPDVLRPCDLADLGLNGLGDLALQLAARLETRLERDIYL